MSDQNGPPSASNLQTLQEDKSPFATPRRRHQAGLFFGGVAFVVFSSLITRRSLARRYKPQIASLHPSHPNATNGLARPSLKAADGVSTSSNLLRNANRAASEASAAEGITAAEEAELNNSGPLLAVEALTVATMNVFSWAIMATGAAFWYFDISNMDDLRRRVRGGFGVDGSGRTEQELEEEMEEWLAGVLARKEDKARIKDEVDALRSGRVNERGKPR